MKIWWINHYAIPPSEPGGTRHYSLARKLKQHGIDVQIIASSFNYVQRQERLDPSETFRTQEIDGVSFSWFRTAPYTGNSISKLRNMLSFSRQLRRRYRELPGGRPDLVIGSSPHPFAADEARKIARRFDVPFCVEIRDLWPQTLVDVGGLSRMHPLVLWMRRVERRLYRDADRILTLLPTSHAHFESFGARSNHILYVPNGIDREMIPDPEPPPSDDIFRVMFVGIHGMVYGLSTIIEAAAILKKDPAANNIRFVLVGDGPEKPGLIKQAEEAGLENIEFRDSVPKERIYEVMQEADAFVMLMKRSGVHQSGISPNKVFDYMSASRPIIFAVETPSNQVEEAGAGVTILPEDPRALADAAADLSRMEPGALEAMGEQGRAWLESNFDLDKLAAGLAASLEQVVDGRSAAG